jgi:hypothetical protein
MVKLITAEEALALCTPVDELDRYIGYINQQIRLASHHGYRRVQIEIGECNKIVGEKITGRLRAAGYCFKWQSTDDRIRLDLQW